MASFETPTLVVLSTGTQCHTQGAQYAPFRPHSHAYYLTGIAEPDVVLFLWSPNPGEVEHYLLISNPPPNQRIWSDTKTLSPRHPLVQDYDHLFFWEDTSPLKKWLSDLPEGFNLLSTDLTADTALLFPPLSENSDVLLQALARMRAVKEPQELASMRQAISISAAGHAEIAKRWASGKLTDNEGAWELFWRSYCWEQGARQQAYRPIIAGQERSCCLHYQANNKELHSCSWVLVDAGAEWQYYASDITRTYFRNCNGTQVQVIYERLLDLQKRLCAAVHVGATLDVLEQQARAEMGQWLHEWGWCSGSLDESIEATKTYFPHRLGHQLGLDVHDNSRLITSSTPLEEGMMVTIEPGFYCSPLLLPPEHPCLGLGIRIEDNVLVTQYGPEVLSSHAPKDWDAISHLAPVS